MNPYNLIASNKRKTFVIMVFFCLFVGMVFYVFGQAYDGYGTSWFVLALFFSIGASFGSYFYGDKIVLAMNGARPADKRKDFDFYTAVENLSIASGLPMPKLYVIESPAMNAFATGRDPKHSVVCATRGLLERLDRSDIEGVIAHEISHIKNYDIRLMLIVAVLVGVVGFLANMFSRSLWLGGRSRDSESRGNGLFMIFGVILALISPIVATLIQLSISRRREYLADAAAVLLTRNPEGLADALEKLSRDTTPLETVSTGTAHLFIVNPFKGKEFGAKVANLFSTHPPIKERIRILRSL